MQSASISARQARHHYRHELRNLTYVTLDEANGGIIRNLSHEGVAVQAVGALRLQQRVRLRFELRFPRLRVDALGQVSWTSPSGQCGISFVDLSARTRLHLGEWIFSNLLDAIARDAAHPGSMFSAAVIPIAGDENAAEENDGLTLSAAPREPIRLEPSPVVAADQSSAERLSALGYESEEMNWLSRPLSERTLARLVDSLVVFAGLLLFALIFLSIAHEVPEWPVVLAAGLVAAVFVAGAYWSLIAVFGGASLGVRLAHAASGVGEDGRDEADRFR